MKLEQLFEAMYRDEDDIPDRPLNPEDMPGMEVVNGDEDYDDPYDEPLTPEERQEMEELGMDEEEYRQYKREQEDEFERDMGRRDREELMGRGEDPERAERLNKAIRDIGNQYRRR